MSVKIVKVKAVRRVEDPELVGDIGVADNHNLFISSEADQPSMLVHNCWGFSSQDMGLLSKFEVGRKLRIQYRKSPSDELKAEIKMRGDFHRLNAQTFFGVDPMDCSDEIRQAVKAIAFGAVYGKSIKSLARDTKTELKEMERIYAAFFKSYPKAKAWLDWAVKSARRNLNVYSILGRKRNLYGYMTGVETLMAAMDRRAMNSPIQGLGSDIGLLSAYLYHLHYYDLLEELGEIDYDTEDLPNGIEAMVHDSSRQCTPYKYVPIVIQLKQWVFTKGAVEYYSDYFGAGKYFKVPIECEFELGWADSSMAKWDWADSSLRKVLRSAVEEQKRELGHDGDVEEIMTEMFSLYESKPCKRLMKAYPFFPE